MRLMAKTGSNWVRLKEVDINGMEEKGRTELSVEWETE